MASRDKGFDTKDFPTAFSPRTIKVSIANLVEAGLINNKEILYFYNNRIYKDEQAEVIAETNKVKYLKDNKTYSVSELARTIRTQLGYRYTDKATCAGPKFWMTKDGKLLNDLNNQYRIKNGYLPSSY